MPTAIELCLLDWDDCPEAEWGSSAMKQIASWFKTAVTTFLDPEHESRVQTLVSAIHRGIQAQGQRFNLEQALLRQEFNPTDLHEAKIRVYRSALERGWSDGELT